MSPHVATSKQAGVAGHQVRSDPDYAVGDFKARDAVEQPQVNFLSKRQYYGVRFKSLQFAGRLRKAFVIKRHLLDRD